MKKLYLQNYAQAKSILFATLVFISPLRDISAQSQLKGKVFDRKSKSGISNATVSVLANGELFEIVQTDYEGRYEIALPEGTYDFVVSINGEASGKRKKVVLEDGDIRNINFNIRKAKDNNKIGSALLGLGKSLAIKLLASDGMDDFKEGVIDDLKNELSDKIEGGSGDDDFKEMESNAVEPNIEDSYLPKKKLFKNNRLGSSNSILSIPKVFTNDPQSPFRNPMSSFGLKVGDRSWTNIEKAIESQTQLKSDSIRMEELINAFEYSYLESSSKSPFHIVSHVTECPWNENVKLLHIGIQGRKGDANGNKTKVLASDLDVFVEFNPAYVDAYRLVGYNSKKRINYNKTVSVNADKVGEGYRVTALYEITPAKDNYASVEERILYQKRIDELIDNGELANIRLKYRANKGMKTWEIKEVISYRTKPLFHVDVPDYVRHASAVAQYGLVVKDSKHKANASIDNAIEILETLDNDKYESANLQLVMNESKNIKK